MLNYYNEKTASWASFVAETGNSGLKLDDMKDPERSPVVLTAGVQRDLDMVRPWVENGESFILVGPEGCGKNLIIRSLIT